MQEPYQVPTSKIDHAEAIVAEVWGYAGLRSQQRKPIVAVLSGRDCLAVLPTGGGKSLCFQIPALVSPGLTIVVSPLISLMQDQVGALRRRGVAAAYLSSTQDRELQRAVWNRARSGHLKLLYVAPERMSRVASQLEPGHVSLLAVDEAHCISEWGHDFRPHFRAIGAHRMRLGRPPTIALTATATPATRRDIARVLGLRRHVEVTTSFDRPNLRFAATRCASESEKLHRLKRLLCGLDGVAVVYAPTRTRVDGVTRILRTWGHRAAPYHAALPPGARRALLRRFLLGEIDVMVATNAFGMGIDKANVRLVAHVGIPARPESYYQEAGRAGRDGKPSSCVLFWRTQDIPLSRFLSGVDRLQKRHPQRAAKLAGLETMERYIKTRNCRRRVLLAYLGQRIDRCAGCDACGPDQLTAN
jgi:ATP-dependent DNA helicase RecQ